jgi:acyl transferase domain-containing protein
MAAKTVFMFSGQGSQYYQMARQLFDENRVFRAWMTRLDDLVLEISGRRVAAGIYARPKSDVFDRLALTHPAIFMVEYSLAQCLIHEGIEPDVVLGASLGAFAAAAIGGCVRVEHALEAVLQQAQVVERCCEAGGMIAILYDPALYKEPFLAGRSELAGVNFDGHFAVSARRCDLEPIEAALKERGIMFQRLPLGFAFHSRWIETAYEPFAALMRAVPTMRGRVPLACCERAALLNGLGDGYFWNVARNPIRFMDTLRMLERGGPHRYIDVGPSGTLATFAKYALPAGSASTVHPILTPYGRDAHNLDAVLASTRPVQPSDVFSTRLAKVS